MFPSHPNFLQKNKQARRNGYDVSLPVYPETDFSALVRILRGEERWVYKVLQFIHFPHWLVWVVTASSVMLSKSVSHVCDFNPSLNPCGNFFRSRTRCKGECWLLKFWKWKRSWYKTEYGQYDISSEAKKGVWVSDIWTLLVWYKLKHRVSPVWYNTVSPLTVRSKERYIRAREK